MECDFKQCQYSGMCAHSDSYTVTATRCGFLENGQCGVACAQTDTIVRLNECTIHHNGYAGITANYYAVVDLHGTKTSIHSNKKYGIHARENAKVNIHLPSHHNTSHDNLVENQNRNQELGGSIANINVDGTFTHDVEEHHW